MDIDKIVESIN